MEFKKLNITLPVRLFNKSRLLIEQGLYSNFSDLVRSSLRKELKDDLPLLSIKDEWSQLIDDFRQSMLSSELRTLSDTEIIERLRKTREEIANEK